MKTKHIIYLFIGCIIPLGFWAISTLTIESDVNAYNLAADQDLNRYQAFVAELGGESNAESNGESIIILEKKSGWNTLQDFQTLEQIRTFWEAQPKVDKASCITNLQYPKQGFFRPQTEPFLDLAQPLRFERRMEQWDRYPDIIGKFISRDRQYALVFIDAPDGISVESSQRFEQSGALKQGIDIHYLQYDLIQDELSALVRHDTIWMAAISLCLILIGFYAFMQSLRGLALIALLIAFNIALTFLVMYALSMQYTLQMITIPCLITVLSFTDIMHMLYHQHKEQKASKNDKDLRHKILSAVRIPLLLTSLTNIVGFTLFLIFSKNIHLFNFSLAAIIGIIIAYLSSRFLAIRLLDKQTIFIKREKFSRLYAIHNKISNWFWTRRNILLPGFILAFALLVIMVSKNLTIDGSEQEYAISNSNLTKGHDILQQQFFGAKQAEVLINIKSGSIWNAQTLNDLEQIEADINQLFEPLYINSPGVLAKRYNRYRLNGSPAAFYIPENLDTNTIAQLIQYQSQLGGHGLIDSTVTKARIVFGYGNMPLAATRERYQQLRNILAQHQSAELDLELSGPQYLSDEATHAFSLKILAGLLLSIGFGSLLVLLYMKSIRKSAGVLLVNLFPMFTALGFMLLLGLSITPLTLVLLSVLLGVCVDDSIYLIFQNRKETDSFHIVPIFITSFVLALGFLSLVFSSFTWLKPFGWIFFLGILLAYILDLFVLQLFLNRKAKFGSDG